MERSARGLGWRRKALGDRRDSFARKKTSGKPARVMRKGGGHSGKPARVVRRDGRDSGNFARVARKDGGDSGSFARVVPKDGGDSGSYAQHIPWTLARPESPWANGQKAEFLDCQHVASRKRLKCQNRDFGTPSSLFRFFRIPRFSGRVERRAIKRAGDAQNTHK